MWRRVLPALPMATRKTWGGVGVYFGSAAHLTPLIEDQLGAKSRGIGGGIFGRARQGEVRVQRTGGGCEEDVHCSVSFKVRGQCCGSGEGRTERRAVGYAN